MSRVTLNYLLSIGYTMSDMLINEISSPDIITENDV